MLKLLKSIKIFPIFFLTLCSFSSFIKPTILPIAVLFSNMFPLWLFLSVVSLILSLRNKIYFLINVCGFIINLFFIFIFVPINLSNSDDNYDLKIVSYNVHNFRRSHILDTAFQKQFVPVFKRFNADIICYQEGSQGGLIKEELSSVYPYHLNTMTVKSSNLGIFSKFPIMGYELIDTIGSNASACFRIQLPDGVTLSILNCHLLSFNFKKSGYTLSGFLNSSSLRGEQIDSICRYLDKHETSNMIVLGDFNEIPISYSHQQFSNRLEDCFVSRGLGFGGTFKNIFCPLRIDHIFCGEGWKALSCRVDKDSELSDHYPIIATLRKK